MKVWRLLADVKSLVVQLENFDSDHKKTEFYAVKIKEWEPVHIRSSVNKNKKSDMISYLPDVPVFSAKASTVLGPYLADSVQFLVAKHDREMFFINVVNVMDCIDYKRSVLRENPWNVFSGFETIYFIKEKIEGQYIFKIPELMGTHVFVTDQFKEIVEKSKLKDFDFIEVWDSELTPEIEEERLASYESKIAEINAW